MASTRLRTDTSWVRPQPRDAPSVSRRNRTATNFRIDKPDVISNEISFDSNPLKHHKTRDRAKSSQPPTNRDLEMILEEVGTVVQILPNDLSSCLRKPSQHPSLALPSFKPLLQQTPQSLHVWLRESATPIEFQEIHTGQKAYVRLIFTPEPLFITPTANRKSIHKGSSSQNISLPKVPAVKRKSPMKRSFTADSAEMRGYRAIKYTEVIEWMIVQNEEHIVYGTTLDELGQFIGSIFWVLIARTSRPKTIGPQDTIILSPYPLVDNFSLGANRSHKRTGSVQGSESNTPPRHTPVFKEDNYRGGILEAIKASKAYVHYKSPLSAQLYFQFAHLLLLDQEFDNAQRTFEQAREICVEVFSESSEEYGICCYNLALIADRREQTTSAAKLFHSYYSLVGALRFTAGDHERAHEAYTKAIDFAPVLGFANPKILVDMYYLTIATMKLEVKPGGAVDLARALLTMFKFNGLEPFSECPVEVDEFVLKDLLAQAYQKARLYPEARDTILEYLQSLFQQYGLCDTFYDTLTRLASVCESCSTCPSSESQLGDAADYVRFTIAALVTGRTLDRTPENHFEMLEMVDRLAHVIVRQGRINNLSQASKEIEHLVSHLDLESLLSPKLRYSFLQFLYPTDMVQLALLDEHVSRKLNHRCGKWLVKLF